MARRVVFQGVSGAYSELAALKYFGDGARPVGLPDFSDVFRAVQKGRSPFGIIPIENSLTGSIHQNFDLLMKHHLWICGEVKLRISHALLAHPGKRLKQLTHVYSHPQGLWQCQGFLRRHPGLEPCPYFDTAGSAKFIADTKAYDAAAIASREAAARYGLKTLHTGIEDNKKNFTRFLVLSRSAQRSQRQSGPQKTSLLFRLKNQPGALHGSLGAFTRAGIQMFKIESRPIPGHPWEYLFYLDCGGRSHSPQVKSAIEELGTHARGIRILGSYSIAT